MARRKKIDKTQLEEQTPVEEIVTKPQIEETPVEEIVTEPVVEIPAKKSTVKEIKLPRFISTKVPQFHPFQRVAIPTGSPGAILEMDSWLDCQIKAGLVKEL